jgi:hypothetical protein
MRYYHAEQRHALHRYETLLSAEIFQGQLPTAEVLLAVPSCPPQSKSQNACRDYSEEAIPERDPAFRLTGGTDYEQPTVEVVSAAARLDLARRLEQLGMSRTKAAAVASL